MSPLSPILLVACVSFAHALPPGGSEYEQALAQAQQAFIEHQPGAPTLETAARLPKAGEDAEARLAISAAGDVQAGCPSPCTDGTEIKIYIAKVEMIARGLKMSDDQVKRAVQNYAPNGLPRLRTGPAGRRNPAAKQFEAAVLQRLLSSEKLAPQIREKLNEQALRMAEKLQWDPRDKPAPDGRGRRPTTEQLRAAPRAQARALRRLATAPPPAPPQRVQPFRLTSDAYGIALFVKDQPQPLIFRKGSEAIAAIVRLPDGSVTKAVFYGHGAPGVLNVGDDFTLDADRTDAILKGKMSPGGVVQFTGCNTSSIGPMTRVSPFFWISTLVRRLSYFSAPYFRDRLHGDSPERARKLWGKQWNEDLARDASLKLRGTIVCGYRTFALTPGRTPVITKLLGNQEAATPGYVAGEKACFLDGTEVKAP